MYMLLNTWGRAVPQHQSPVPQHIGPVRCSPHRFCVWVEGTSLATYLPTYLVELPANDRSSPPPPVAPLPASFFPFLWLCYNNTCLLMCALFLCRRRCRPFHNMLYRYIQQNNNDNARQRNKRSHYETVVWWSIHPSKYRTTNSNSRLTDWLTDSPKRS